ncbi:hypothetical protein [Clostridium baratii]|uniref:Uncharacterized protein n=1 Tax=Clostridium baratii TaxID=1561 RepID=A0A174VS44_9CLOT|nr:hypothetical protein [Clostridium baratii]CUQ35157.1 Uncharacterised protein [Clostridium baratii]
MKSIEQLKLKIKMYEDLIDRATLENKEGILKYSDYSKKLEIYNHKISLLEWVLSDNLEIDFNMVNEEKRKIDIPYKYIVLILESLNNFKADIQNYNTDGILNKMKFQYKLEEINDLINIIENKADYNFNKRLEKCKCKKSDDIGLDGVEAVFNIKK